ncbi:YcgL domain-containing protein [Oleiagrimonas sp.]|uniref:YcgL domain-containing protein n=1 Tax=Oleiagrimonas sp. TaxID=2010330 RepID=UPI00260A6586|nr:YcgL domain-containing protein [Oleiagrimonas sp.]MDA3913912.1 YcgL domain-containing protein [Oleiagrimonas sp.]
MHCQVYASQRKTGAYLWATGAQVLEDLPDALQELLGALRLVMEIKLEPSRKLPRENPREVLANLRTQGWHLQMPATEPDNAPM